MADAALLNQIRNSMRVRTSDGQKLGTVRQVHQSEMETYVEVTLAWSLWKPWHWITPARHVFLPGITVTSVAGKQVEIVLDAKSAKSCTWHPSWIPQDYPQFAFGGDGGGS